MIKFLALILLFSTCFADKEKDEREALEPYMRNIYRMISTKVNGFTEIISNAYSYEHKTDTFFGLVFDEIIGAVVHPGYKTRQFHNDKVRHPCVGLKKLYQRWIETDHPRGRYELSTNFLDTNNKGDRQPIGMCGKYRGHCGATIPLNVYKASDLVYYGSKIRRILNVNFTAMALTPICYLFERSEKQIKREENLVDSINFNVGSIHDDLVKVYGIHHENFTEYTTDLSSVPKITSEDHLAFNLIKKESREKFSKHCQLRAIAQYKNKQGQTAIFDDPQHDEVMLKDGYTPYPSGDKHILGYGFQRLHYCGSRVKYSIMQDKSTKHVFASESDPGDRRYVAFHKAFFYSL